MLQDATETRSERNLVWSCFFAVNLFSKDHYIKICQIYSGLLFQLTKEKKFKILAAKRVHKDLH